MQPMNNMEKKLKEARFALMTMFEVLEKDILYMNSRKQPIVHARMFYNYYLWKKFKIPHNHIKTYIDGMHHATSIYLKNKLEHDIKTYDSVAMEWQTFLFFANYQEWKQQRSIKEMQTKYII
jgi:dimeric dUTPase (all-alpha-NTP-PPase superfamily)